MGARNLVSDSGAYQFPIHRAYIIYDVASYLLFCMNYSKSATELHEILSKYHDEILFKILDWFSQAQSRSY